MHSSINSCQECILALSTIIIKAPQVWFPRSLWRFARSPHLLNLAVDWFNPSHGILWLLKLGNFITQINHEIDLYNDSINLTHQPLLGRYCLRLSPTEPGTAILFEWITLRLEAAEKGGGQHRQDRVNTFPRNLSSHRDSRKRHNPDLGSIFAPNLQCPFQIPAAFTRNQCQ